MTVLVTGGAGYIGAHTSRALTAAGHDVVVLDSLELGRRAMVGTLPLVVGDIANQGLVAALVREHGVDSCIHFAAYKAAGESMVQPGRYFANNVAGTNTLIEALQREGVEAIVFSSSCAVYGTPELLPVSEATPVHPESPYGESKLLVERVLGWYDTCLGVRSMRLRYFNAAGAAADGTIGEDWTVALNLVPLAMKALLGARPPLEVFGTDYPTPDGTAVRDYVHVDDLADAHVRALEHLLRGGPSATLNLGTGTGSSVRQVLAAAGRAAGRPVPAADVARRPGDPTAIWADATMAAGLLDWRATRTLDEIVASAWAWHSRHR
ncbi:MAG: UDP-glucose 4-epimerase GalE [Acidimicrobiales bacterium]